MNAEMLEYLGAMAVVDDNRPKPKDPSDRLERPVTPHSASCCKWAPILPPIPNLERQS